MPRIFYLVLAPYRGTMLGYLRSWGEQLDRTVEIITYDVLLSRDTLESGAYIFSDLDRLSGAQRALLADVYNAIISAGPAFTALNDPARVLDRYQLLRTLRETGRNAFSLYRLDEIPEKPQRPLFLRHLRQHAGAFTQPGSSAEQLLEEIATLVMINIAPADIGVAEFLDTADDEGVYRKYSAFRVGEEIVPRHLIFSSGWDLKYPDLLEPQFIAEEWEYLETNPHRAEIAEIFGIANIEYGRIDYSLHEGSIQTWEINTNPIIMLQPEEYAEEHRPAQEWFAPRITDAFLSLVDGLPPADPIPLPIRSQTVQKIIHAPSEQAHS